MVERASWQEAIEEVEPPLAGRDGGVLAVLTEKFDKCGFGVLEGTAAVRSEDAWRAAEA
jgi:hypothetical protein